MHQRNPYCNNPPNFSELSKLYPELLKNVIIQSNNGNGYFIDWTNSESQRILTKVLLLHDFNLNVNLPPNRLCPPVPNRINYLCWLSELFEFKINDFPHLTKDQFNSIPILDIGVGASCIYPLLGHKMFGWNFYGSDIDQESLEWANNQIITNNLENSIKLSKVEPSTHLQLMLKEILSTENEITLSNSNEIKQNNIEHINHLLQRINQIIENNLGSFRGPIRQFLISLGGLYASTVVDCESQRNLPSNYNNVIILAGCMSNPPFYSQEDEIGINPKTICLGTQNEMITEGGEISFILGILIDSLVLKTKVGWYTSMIGKKSSLRVLLRFLRGVGVTHIFSTRFIQGKKGKSTVRWGVAWTFLDILVPLNIQFSMVHKVFGQKKLRKRREACTQIQTINISSFLSTIDPFEVICMQNYSQTNEINHITHSIIPTNLINFINTYPISQKTITIQPTEINSLRKLICTCPNCILNYSFLRVLNSFKNNTLLSFNNIEVRKERKSSLSETHFVWEIYFHINSQEQQQQQQQLDNLPTDFVKLCVKLTAIVKDVNIESNYNNNNNNRKRSTREDSEYHQPIRKRTKIGNDDDDDDDDDSSNSGESDDNDDSNNNEDSLINIDSSSHLVNEWSFEKEKNCVDFLQFSIFLVTNINQDHTSALSPNLRKVFFNLSEQLELDILRTNRRWRRYFNNTS